MGQGKEEGDLIIDCCYVNGLKRNGELSFELEDGVFKVMQEKDIFSLVQEKIPPQADKWHYVKLRIFAQQMK